jgi:ribosomal-protein-alanine N-acetyltransferase
MPTSYPLSTSSTPRDMSGQIPYVVEPMALSDLDQVMDVERATFSLPWSKRAYRYEVVDNEHSTMVVVRPATQLFGRPARWLQSLHLAKPEPVLGYAGFWLLVDDAHVATIAVHPDWRGRGLGELLLASLLERAMALGARRATLEVRVSNRTARALYVKYGFQILERRRRYYSDNNEDGYFMVTPPFEAAAFQENLERRLAALKERLSK